MFVVEASAICTEIKTQERAEKIYAVSVLLFLSKARTHKLIGHLQRCHVNFPVALRHQWVLFHA